MILNNSERASKWNREHKERRREISKKYHQKHKEKESAYSKKYRQLHEEERLKYRMEHKDKTKKYDHKRYLMHKEESKQRASTWAKTYSNKRREIVSKCSKKHPEHFRKKNYKRRMLGFIPLNEPFKNSEAHHTDKLHVIHIPKDLHHSVKHNVYTGLGMEEINEKAIEYLRL